MSEAERELQVRRILRDVWRAYAKHWKFLVPLAMVVLLPQALADAIDIRVDTADLNPGKAALAGLGTGGVIAFALGGEALYAGIVTALVLEWRHGVRGVGPVQLARDLPLGRLILADLILSTGIAFGLALVVIPGVLFGTYFLLTTVVIETEDARLVPAMRRSADLVRGSFWRVLAIGLVAVLGTEAVSAALEAPFHGIEVETAVNLAVEALLEPFQGLATVLVAFSLMELRGEDPADLAEEGRFRRSAA